MDIFVKDTTETSIIHLSAGDSLRLGYYYYESHVRFGVEQSMFPFMEKKRLAGLIMEAGTK